MEIILWDGKNAYITPVLKGGSLDGPNNYRGISILSCIAKLFNTILTKRLDTFLDSHKVISPIQIGFTKKARTSDHMFVLRTLIEKYTKYYKGKLYTCFIDFRKAFDRVEYYILFYKLRQRGTSGNFYDIIKNIRICMLSIKMKSGFTQPVPLNIGVRQGNTLTFVICFFFFFFFLNKLSLGETFMCKVEGMNVKQC